LYRTQDKVRDLFEKLALDKYEFKHPRKNSRHPTHGKYASNANPCCRDHFMNSHDPSNSYIPLVLCDYCESSDHDVRNYPYHDYVNATCVSIEKTIHGLTQKMVETMKERITEYSHYFNHSRDNYNEPDSYLASPKSKVSLYVDFGPSYLTRSDLHDDMPFPSL